jgi:hypothetical protein
MPEEIKKRRAEKDVTDTLMALHDWADTCFEQREVNTVICWLLHLYMLNGWDELLNYRNDGRYTIENFETERTVRTITRVRKNSLHHSREDGLQMASLI